MAGKKKSEPKPSASRRARGRPVKPTPKIPDTFENVIKALVKPVKEEERELAD